MKFQLFCISSHEKLYLICLTSQRNVKEGQAMTNYGPIYDEEELSFISESVNTTNSRNVEQRHDDRPILVATAVPHSIRPPQIYLDHEMPPSFAKKASILVCGLLFALLSFIDSIVYIEFSLGSKIKIFAGFLWLISFVALILGSIIGFIRGQWRMLAPGIIASHLASFMIRLII